MKLYDYPGAPNPRRVKIFLDEKGLAYEAVNCDMAKGEHKLPAFLEKNPSGKIPVLELDDGRCLAESVAICRYLEAIQPEPNLFGRDPFELGHIEMRNRQIELELWTQVGVSWVNGPIVTKMWQIEPNVIMNAWIMSLASPIMLQEAGLLLRTYPSSAPSISAPGW